MLLSLPRALTKMDRYDCYLSYDQCKGCLLFREKVERVHKYLEYRNILATVLDTTSSMTRRKELYERIDSCGCVVLLLSSTFLEDRGQLRSEFGYVIRSKGRGQICLAVMEQDILGSVWQGEVGEMIKGKKIADLSSNDPGGLHFKRQLDELHEMILSCVVPIKVCTYALCLIISLICICSDFYPSFSM